MFCHWYTVNFGEGSWGVRKRLDLFFHVWVNFSNRLHIGDQRKKKKARALQPRVEKWCGILTEDVEKDAGEDSGVSRAEKEGLSRAESRHCEREQKDKEEDDYRPGASIRWGHREKWPPKHKLRQKMDRLSIDQSRENRETERDRKLNSPSAGGVHMVT